MLKRRRAALAAAVLAGAAAAGVLLPGASARAATLSWDADGAGPNFGGSGAWNTTSALWTANGTSYVTWNNGTPDSAVFGGTPGAVTLGTAITANALRFNTNDYTIDLSAKAFKTTGGIGFGPGVSWFTMTSTAAATYTAVASADTAGSLMRLGGAVTLTFAPKGSDQFGTDARNIELVGTAQRLAANGASGANAITLTGQISGTGALTLAASQGELILTGANSYSGATSVSNTTVLVAGNDSAFGTTPSITISAATTLGFEGDADGSTNVGAIPLTLNGATPVNGLPMLFSFAGNNSFGGTITGANPARSYGADVDSTLTLTGVISHSRGLTKTGPGTVVLTGANTYGTGNVSNNDNATTVGDGTLRLDFSQSGVAADIVNNGSGSITGNQSSELLLAGGTLEVKGKPGATNSQRFKDRATGAAVGLGFRINPGASSVLVNQNGAANVLLSVGRISMRQIGGTVDFTLPTGSQTATNGITVGTNGNVNGILGGFATVGGTDWATTGTIGATTPITPLATYTNDTWAAGNNTNVTTSSAPASDGKTNSLRFDAASANTVTLAGTNTITSGGILVTSRVGANDSTITGGTLAGTVNPGTSTYVTGNYGSDLIVHQNNTAGALKLDSVIADPAGPAGRNGTASSGATSITMATNTRDMYVGMIVSGSGIQPGTTVTGISSDTVASISLATTAALSATPVTFTGVSGLTKSGPGVLELSKPNTYSGATNVNGGVLKLSNASALGGGNLALHGGVIGLTAASGNFTRQLGATAGSVQFLGSGGFAAYGGDRVVNLGGASNQVIWHSGGFVPTLSNLVFGAADADGMTDFQNPIRLMAIGHDQSPLSRTIQVANGSGAIDARLSGALTNQGGIIKTGLGALELTAANTYTGTTNVNAGTLILTGTHTGGGPYTVGDRVHAAAFAGTGSTTSAVEVVDQGIISPGAASLPNSVGTLTTASLTLDQGSSYAADINFTTNLADQIQIGGGSVSLDGDLRMQMIGLDSSAVASTRTFMIIRNADAAAAPVNGHFRNIFPATTEFATVTVDYGYNGDGDGKFNDVAVTFEAVPEPASMTMLAACAALLARRSRRHLSRT